STMRFCATSTSTERPHVASQIRQNVCLVWVCRTRGSLPSPRRTKPAGAPLPAGSLRSLSCFIGSILERDVEVADVRCQALAQRVRREAPVLGCVAVRAELPLRLVAQVRADALGVRVAELPAHRRVG